MWKATPSLPDKWALNACTGRVTRPNRNMPRHPGRCLAALLFWAGFAFVFVFFRLERVAAIMVESFAGSPVRIGWVSGEQSAPSMPSGVVQLTKMVGRRSLRALGEHWTMR